MASINKEKDLNNEEPCENQAVKVKYEENPDVVKMEPNFNSEEFVLGLSSVKMEDLADDTNSNIVPDSKDWIRITHQLVPLQKENYSKEDSYNLKNQMNKQYETFTESVLEQQNFSTEKDRKINKKEKEDLNSTNDETYNTNLETLDGGNNSLTKIKSKFRKRSKRDLTKPNISTICKSTNESVKTYNEQGILSLISQPIRSGITKSKFGCELCKKHFQSTWKLKKHKDTECGTLKQFSCVYCAKGFTGIYGLKSHINICPCNRDRIKSVFQCKICSKNFYWESSLTRHFKKVHEKLDLTSPQKCDLCQKTFSSRKNVQNHVYRTHSLEKFECGHCSKMFTYKDKLREHIARVHNFKSRESSSLEKEKSFSFVCDKCGKGFRSKLKLVQHLRIHSNELPFVCDVCGKCFRSDSNLSQHSWTHSDIRPFVCDLCGKSFRIKNHLRQHMAVHGMVNTSWRGKRKMVVTFFEDSKKYLAATLN